MSYSPAILAGKNMLHAPITGTNVVNPNTAYQLPSKDLSPEEKIARDIIRRRELEAQRRARIFDPKVRQIGIDVDALDSQVEEKKRRDAEEAERERQYADQTLFINNVMKKQDIEAARVRREAESNTRDFSLTNLRKEQGDGWDLNDPDRLKKQTIDGLGPATAASMRVFQGEDELSKERAAAQKRQQREWIQQHLLEKELHKQAEQENDRNWANQSKQIHNATLAIETEMSRARREAEANRARANLDLNAERVQRELEAQLKEQQENANEIDRNLRDPMLADGRLHLTGHLPLHEAATGGIDGGDKYTLGTRKANYRGMTRDERQQYLDDNLQQWRDKYQRAKHEQDQEQQWADQYEMQRRTLVGVERERQKFQRRLNEEVCNGNLSLAKEQRARNEFHNRTLYGSNPVEDSYFEYFGTTTR